MSAKVTEIAKIDSLITKQHQIKDNQFKDRQQIKSLELKLKELKEQKEAAELRIKQSEDKLEKYKKQVKDIKLQIRQASSDKQDQHSESESSLTPQQEIIKPLKSCMKKQSSIKTTLPAPAQTRQSSSSQSNESVQSKPKKTLLRKRKHSSSEQQEQDDQSGTVQPTKESSESQESSQTQQIDSAESSSSEKVIKKTRESSKESQPKCEKKRDVKMKQKQSSSCTSSYSSQKAQNVKTKGNNSSFFNPKIHEKNQKNADYFICPQQNETLKKLRNKQFKSMEKMRADLDKLNKDFRGSCEIQDQVTVGIVCNMKSQNAYLKCIYKDCKYEHWFTYTKGGDQPTELKYSRSINMNHSFNAHKSGAKREVEFL